MASFMRWFLHYYRIDRLSITVTISALLWRDSKKRIYMSDGCSFILIDSINTSKLIKDRSSVELFLFQDFI